MFARIQIALNRPLVRMLGTSRENTEPPNSYTRIGCIGSGAGEVELSEFESSGRGLTDCCTFVTE
jgi:hypothetical protein